MATEDSPQTPNPSPLDAERARLRQAGYTDNEISQILISRASGSSPQAVGVGVGVGGQSVLGGVLANMGALLSHARNALPNLLADFKNTFDGQAAAPARAKSLGALVVKLAIIGVIGYAVKQEWDQHIISATEIAAFQPASESPKMRIATASQRTTFTVCNCARKSWTERV